MRLHLSNEKLIFLQLLYMYIVYDAIIAGARSDVKINYMYKHIVAN